MAAFRLPRGRNTQQPQGPSPQIDWSNPLTLGLVFAFAPGSRVNAVGPQFPSVPAPLNNTASGTRVDGGSLFGPPTTGSTGVTGFDITGSGTSILGGLQNSTVAGVFRTTAVATNPAGNGNDGEIGGGGDAIYCERSTSGNDIYKIAVSIDASRNLQCEFTYRNDAGTLLQQYQLDSTLNNGAPHFCAGVKNGTTHTTWGSNGNASGTFGSGSSQFLDATRKCVIGYDAADTNSNWNGFIDFVAGWNRSLSDSEMYALRANPWQIFRPRSAFLFSGVSVQTVYPASDISAGNWTPSTGISLYATINENPASDVQYDSTPNASTMVVKLQSASSPGVTTGHVVNYRCKGAGILTIDLMQGATVIATWTHNPAPAVYTTFAQAVTSLQAANITDYTDLRLRFAAS